MQSTKPAGGGQARRCARLKKVRITQIDGKLPNVALMKLADWHKARGDEVHATYRVERDLFEPAWDVVYGSVLFSFSADRLARFQKSFPDVIIGGTGSGDQSTVEALIGIEEYEQLDYSGWPDFTGSIGWVNFQSAPSGGVRTGIEVRNTRCASSWRDTPVPRPYCSAGR